MSLGKKLVLATAVFIIVPILGIGIMGGLYAGQWAEDDPKAEIAKPEAEQKAELGEKQRCEAEGYQWKSKSWPLSGNYCNRAPYQCGFGHIQFLTADRMRKLYINRLSQAHLDVEMGRRFDFNATEDDNEYLRAIEKGTEEEINKAKEYLDHGCTLDADKARELIESLQRNIN